MKVGPGGESSLQNHQLSSHIATIKVFEILKVGMEVDEIDANCHSHTYEENKADRVSLFGNCRRGNVDDSLLRTFLPTTIFLFRNSTV